MAAILEVWVSLQLAVAARPVSQELDTYGFESSPLMVGPEDNETICGAVVCRLVEPANKSCLQDRSRRIVGSKYRVLSNPALAVPSVDPIHVEKEQVQSATMLVAELKVAENSAALQDLLVPLTCPVLVKTLVGGHKDDLSLIHI